MKLIIKAKNMTVSEPVREYVEKKIGRLERFLPSVDMVRVELSVQQVRSSNDRLVVQVTMYSGNTILRAEERNADIFAAIDAVRDKLQRQMKRYKERPIRMRQRARAAAPEAVEEEEEATEELSSRWNYWATTFSSFSTSTPVR